MHESISALSEWGMMIFCSFQQDTICLRYLVPVVPVRCNDSLISAITGALLTTVLVMPYLHSVSSRCIQSASWKACLQLVSVFQACV